MHIFRNFGLGIFLIGLAACSSTNSNWRGQSNHLGFRAEATAVGTAAFDEWYWRSQYFTYDPYYGVWGAGIWQDPWFRWDRYGRYSINRFARPYGWPGYGYDFGYFGPSHGGFFDGFHYGFGGLFGPMPQYRHINRRSQSNTPNNGRVVEVDQDQLQIDRFRQDLERSERRFEPKPWESTTSSPLFGEPNRSRGFPEATSPAPIQVDRQERRDASEPE
jgi:hypothetical protein